MTKSLRSTIDNLSQTRLRFDPGALIIADTKEQKALAEKWTLELRWYSGVLSEHLSRLQVQSLQQTIQRQSGDYPLRFPDWPKQMILRYVDDRFPSLHHLGGHERHRGVFLPHSLYLVKQTRSTGGKYLPVGCLSSPLRPPKHCRSAPNVGPASRRWPATPGPADCHAFR
jgi:hypothetical protein